MKIKEKRFFELIREYLTVFLPLQKSSSSHTIKSYKETLNAFLTFLCSYLQKPLKDISFSSVTPDSINAFLQWLEVERGCKTSTLNHHLSVIRAFLKYASIREPVYNDCYLSAGQVVRRKEETKYIVKHFNDDALRAMLFQPNPAIKNEHRDQFCMILLYDTGARNSELLNLRLQDVVIDTSTPYIIIRGKGKKIRSVPIMMETVRHFESYIKRFHKTTDPDSLLFYTIIHRQIQRMSDDNVARFIQKYATKAKAVCPTVPEKVTPHMFRHSRALSLYRKGVPLPLIAEWLGHSNLETTLIYAYADTEMKRAAIEKATGQNHPLRSTETFIEEHLLDDDMIKKLYGLC